MNFADAKQLQNIPQELKGLTRWVGWRLEKRNGKNTKVPYQVRAPARKASTTNPNTWCSFDEAFMSIRRFDGIGFVLNGDGIIGIDLDKCRDKESGIIEDWAKEILDRVNGRGYVELSPSGSGFHIIVRGLLPSNAKSRSGGIEIYSQDRYFTMTGEVYV